MAKQIIADHRRVLLPGWDGDLIEGRQGFV